MDKNHLSTPYRLAWKVSDRRTENQSLSEAWYKIIEKLAFYDYIRSNLAKGGLFKAGAIENGDGIVVWWLGHPVFRDKEGRELSGFHRERGWNSGWVHRTPCF